MGKTIKTSFYSQTSLGQVQQKQTPLTAAGITYTEQMQYLRSLKITEESHVAEAEMRAAVIASPLITHSKTSIRSNARPIVISPLLHNSSYNSSQHH